MRPLRRWLLVASAVAALQGRVPAGQAAAPDPYDVFSKCVALAPADRRRIDAGETLVRTLPERDGFVAVFSTRRVNINGDRLIEWVRRIDALKQGPQVVAIARFSMPPQITDLDALSLSDEDLETIRDCRPSHCAVKLTAAEMERLQHEIRTSGKDWKPALQQAFRQLVLHRVKAYIAGGHAGLGQWADDRSPQPLEAVFSSILARSPCLAADLPELSQFLKNRGLPANPSIESLVYWSKEQFGAKPTLSVTHAVMFRRNGDAIVAGKQIFATHYMNGSLNLTAIVGTSPGAVPHLVVLNRTNVDVVRGFFGGMARMILERRIRSEAAEIVEQFARRLESGPPPPPKTPPSLP